MSYKFTIKGKLVFIDPAAEYGYWERKDGSEGGGLWFEGKTLVDYDGAFDLPRAVYDELRELGFKVEA
jgi:hypothetical protein